LKNLDCYGLTKIPEGSEKSAIEIVGKLYGKLKNLHLEMEFPNVEAAITRFKAFPEIKIEINNKRVIVRKPTINQSKGSDRNIQSVISESKYRDQK
jgi:hypothetical protein